MNHRIPLIVITTLFLLSACSASSPASESEVTEKKKADISSSYDPCDLLTTADVQGLFPGNTITLDQHDTEPNPVGMKICFYSASDDDMKFAQLAVTNVADAPSGIVDGKSLRPLYDSELGFLEPADIQEVTGLGNAAYYGGSGLKPGAGLHVLSDAHGVKLDISVGLGFGNDDQSAHLNMEKAIAKKALSRL